MRESLERVLDDLDGMLSRKDRQIDSLLVQGDRAIEQRDAALARVRELEAEKSNLTIHNNNLASQHESARLALWAEQDTSRKLGEMLEEVEAEKAALEAEVAAWRKFGAAYDEWQSFRYTEGIVMIDGKPCVAGSQVWNNKVLRLLKEVRRLRIKATGRGGDGG